MIILDTNVVSELMRVLPEPRVVTWARGRPASELFTTAVTVAEVRYGIARLPGGRRKESLWRAADAVFSAFPSQILAFDAAAAQVFADLVADRERGGAPIGGFDGQIAAVCRVHGAVLATRNVADFAGTGVETLDPWQVLPQS